MPCLSGDGVNSNAMVVNGFSFNAITGYIASMAIKGKLQYHAGLGAISNAMDVSKFSFNAIKGYIASMAIKD